MKFKNLKQLVDVRNSLPRHRTKRFPVVGVNRKEDIAIHHSLTKIELSGSNAEGYARYHVKSHGWPGIGYHFVIEKDGTIKWCNDLELRSYHVGNYNNQSVGICLSGDFRTDQPTAAQKSSLIVLVNTLKTDLPNYKRILGHSDYPGYEWKQCPVLDWRAILENKKVDLPKTNETTTIQLPTGILRRGDRGAGVKQLQKGLNAANFRVGAEDGIFGSKTEDGVRRFQSIYLPREVDGIYGPNTRKALLER